MKRLALIAVLVAGCGVGVGGYAPPLADMAPTAQDGGPASTPGGEVPPGFYQFGCQWDAPGGPCGDPRPRLGQPQYGDPAPAPEVAP